MKQDKLFSLLVAWFCLALLFVPAQTMAFNQPFYNLGLTNGTMAPSQVQGYTALHTRSSMLLSNLT